MSALLSARLAGVVSAGRGILVLSAHLDDAILSCGALLSFLAGRVPVTVATLFTEAGPAPHTRAARSFLGQCAFDDAAELYATRRHEDIDVLAGLGVEHAHLGAADALFRQRDVGPVTARVGRVVPEVVHRYPTFRLDIDKGRVSAGDRALVDRLDAELGLLAESIDAAVVFGPVGIGRHVDHLLTRTLAMRQPRPTVLYADFPYVLRDAPDARYVAAHRLTPETWDQDLDAKQVLIKGYHTQVAALFPPAGEVPEEPETYFLPPEARTTGSSGACSSPAGRRRPWVSRRAPAASPDPRAGRALVMGYLDLAVPLHAAGASVAMVGAATRPEKFSRYVSRWVNDPRPDEDALVAALLAEGSANPEPTVLFYQADNELLLISRRRDELSAGLRFVMPEADLVEKLVDKAEFQELATRLDLPVPRGQVLDLSRPVLDDRLEFPLLVKPLRREKSWDDTTPAKAAMVGDAGELDALVERLRAQHPRLMVQEPVHGPESCIESYHVYVDSRGQVAAEFTGRKLRTYPQALGHSTAVVTSEAPDVVRLGRQVIEALDLRGVAKLDFKRDAAGRLWLLEVNPRFNMWHHVGAAAGVNIPGVVFADLVGRPRPAVTAARPGTAWCRVDRDHLAARETGMPMASWLRWMAAADVRTPIDLSDPVPLLAGVVGPACRRLRRRVPAGTAS